MSFERFCQPALFMQLDLHWDSPKLPWGMHGIWRAFVLETIIMPFERLFIPWHSLIRSLYFIQVYTSDTFRSNLVLLTHFTLHQFFPMYITTRNIFLIPDDTIARNFNFSSQRPHLNYIFLSNVYSFDTMEFSMKQVLTCSYLPTELQAMLFNKSESLECTKVVVSKLGTILFYSGIHFKPLKLWKKSQRSQ